MKINILATIALTALLAVSANGQGAGGAGGAGAGGTSGTGTGGTATSGTTGTGTSSGVNSVPNNPAVVNPRINSGVVTVPPNQDNVNQGNITLAPPVNPNTPVVGNGMGANNLNLGSNNLAIGTNGLGLGSNQFALRTNGLGTNFLTPTGSNGSGFLSNNVFINPTASTNRVLLNP
jgi:hypothetical protein